MEMFNFDDEMAKDRRRTKSINGKSYVFQCQDPYGFWTIYVKEYNKEVELPGQYTSLTAAENAARVHAQPKVKEVKSSGFKSDQKKE